MRHFRHTSLEKFQRYVKRPGVVNEKLRELKVELPGRVGKGTVYIGLFTINPEICEKSDTFLVCNSRLCKEAVAA